MSTGTRHLIVVLGDQLDVEAAAFDGFDAARDRVFMAEVDDESSHVWSTKPRIAIFLAAMRLFAGELTKRGWALDYQHLDDAGAAATLQDALAQTLKRRQPERVRVTAPGDWRVLKAIRTCCSAAGVPLELLTDRHFYASVQDFRDHARNRRQLRMEYWYRELRRREDVLMENGEPAGGRWNFDSDNRGHFGNAGPDEAPSPPNFSLHDSTRDVLALVNRRYADRAGSLDDFSWPLTRRQARLALNRFIEQRLPLFGRYQDAMWTAQPWLYHSQLSAALNLKLLDPREVVGAAVQAWRAGQAPLPAVEGFVRQILGWREYVRGIYWTQMPDYASLNALDAQADLPNFYWTGDTDCVCLQDAIGQTLRYGYAHHIQRLMVTGLYALLLAVEPAQVHRWYLAVYVDAVEWVEMPNTLGMSQFADGGLMASKPYIASGRYIQRMSNYCAGCRYDPAVATGPKACPFTTLYWDFVARHRKRLAANPRTVMQVRNLERKDGDELREIQQAATRLRA